jgi:hypothetical protein
MRCRYCDITLAQGAKYCPSCGRKARRQDGPPFAADAHPADAPLPRQGKIMIALGGAGLLALGAGIAVRTPWLMIAGGGLMLLVLLLLFVGDFIF